MSNSFSDVAELFRAIEELSLEVNNLKAKLEREIQILESQICNSRD